jgi:hypothetical protein
VRHGPLPSSRGTWGSLGVCVCVCVLCSVRQRRHCHSLCRRQCQCWWSPSSRPSPPSARQRSTHCLNLFCLLCTTAKGPFADTPAVWMHRSEKLPTTVKTVHGQPRMREAGAVPGAWCHDRLGRSRLASPCHTPSARSPRAGRQVGMIGDRDGALFVLSQALGIPAPWKRRVRRMCRFLGCESYTLVFGSAELIRKHHTTVHITA